jgi:hypothetical protein
VGNYSFNGLFDRGHCANDTKDMESIRYPRDIRRKQSKCLHIGNDLT